MKLTTKQIENIKYATMRMNAAHHDGDLSFEIDFQKDDNDIVIAIWLRVTNNNVKWYQNFININILVGPRGGFKIVSDHRSAGKHILNMADIKTKASFYND